MTILITGATSGIGRATAVQLAGAGHRLIVHGRDAARGQALASELGPDVRSVTADLADLSQVRGLADEVRRLTPQLDVVINNAAVWANQRTLSADGHEVTLAVNFLAPFLLTNRLAALMPNGRIVNVASRVQADRLALDDIQGETHYSAWDAYGRSKTYLIMATYMWARRLAPTTVNAIHPGVIATRMLRATGNSGGAPTSSGALRLLYAATDPALADVTGVFLADDRPEKSRPVSYDEAQQAALWAVAEELTR